MIVTYEPATDIVIPNITVDRKYNDGVLSAYRLKPNEGYVLHDTTADETLYGPEGNVIEVVVQYSKEVFIPIRYDPSVWTWEAVKESEAKEYEESI